MGRAARLEHDCCRRQTRERPMPQRNDLSRSAASLDHESTLIAVIEMSQSSWLVAAIVPGIERRGRGRCSCRALTRLLLVTNHSPDGRGGLRVPSRIGRAASSRAATCPAPQPAAGHGSSARRQPHSLGSKNPSASGAGGYRRGKQPHPETTRPAPRRWLGSQRPPPDALRPPSVHNISRSWGNEGDTN